LIDDSTTKLRQALKTSNPPSKNMDKFNQPLHKKNQILRIKLPQAQDKVRFPDIYYDT